MDLNQLRELLELVREHELSEFEIEHEGLRLKVRKDGAGTMVAPPHSLAAPVAAPSPTATAGTASTASPSTPTAAPVAAPDATDTEIELAVVKSPIVGTFYRSPEPGASSFVDIGTSVKKGQKLCIIEAMKLMNEIDSEYDGEIVNIYVDNGQPVQYGERLFAIRTK
jgi:acetyl-CoA carboxylase biotin carboxyl carrier protein